LYRSSVKIVILDFQFKKQQQKLSKKNKFNLISPYIKYTTHFFPVLKSVVALLAAPPAFFCEQCRRVGPVDLGKLDERTVVM